MFVSPTYLLRSGQVVDIIHPGVANVSKAELGEMIAKVRESAVAILQSQCYCSIASIERLVFQ